MALTAEVVALLRESIDAFDEEAFRAVAGDRLDDATAANLRTGIRAATEAFVAHLEDPGRPVDRSLFVAHGRAQYRAGRTLEEMLGFYQLSALTFWRCGSELALSRGIDAEVAAELAEAIMGFVHELSAAAATGYAEERAAGDRERHARRQHLFALVMSRPPAPPEQVARAADAAEWPLPDRVVALAVPLGTPWAAAPPTSRVLTGELDGFACVLLPADDELEWHVGRMAADAGHRAAAGNGGGAVRDGRAGVAEGGVAPAAIGRGDAVDWRDARTSFDHAVAVLRLARAGRIAAGPVVAADDHAVDLLLAADPGLGERIVARRLCPLLELEPARRARLTETLAAWLATPDRPQAMADQLHLHVQTVRYRLSQLRELLGDVLDDPAARFELAVALRIAGPPGGAS